MHGCVLFYYTLQFCRCEYQVRITVWLAVMYCVFSGLALFGLVGYFYRKVFRTEHNNRGCLTVRWYSKQLLPHARDNVWPLLPTRKAARVSRRNTSTPLECFTSNTWPDAGSLSGAGFDFTARNARSCACVRPCVLSYSTFPCLFPFASCQDAQALRSRVSAAAWAKAAITMEIFSRKLRGLHL